MSRANGAMSWAGSASFTSFPNGRSIGVLFPKADFGKTEAITVQLLVAAVISLNPITHSNGHSHSRESACNQNRGSGTHAGTECCSGVASRGGAGRFRLSGLTTTLAARSSNACTIFSSYSGRHSSAPFIHRLAATR